jgi:hypothetical protein
MEYLEQRQLNKAYYDACRAINELLPDLAMRIFQLRGKFYPGCGCHYALECSLGRLLAECNAFGERKQICLESQILLEVLYESLLQQVKEAEEGLLPNG